MNCWINSAMDNIKKHKCAATRGPGINPDCTTAQKGRTQPPLPGPGSHRVLRAQPRGQARREPQSGTPHPGLPIPLQRLPRLIFARAGQHLQANAAKHKHPQEAEFLNTSDERRTRWLLVLCRGHTPVTALQPQTRHRVRRWSSEVSKVGGRVSHVIQRIFLKNIHF